LLICPNHFGTLDPALVPAYMPRPDTWNMAKAEWFRGSGIVTWGFRQYHAFPVVRHSPDRSALRRSLEILKDGQALILYPEGTRIDEGGLRTPEPGAGYIALRSQAAVLPVAVVGTREVLPRHAYVPRRAPVTITFGPPIRVRQLKPDGTRVTSAEAAGAIMLAVAKALPAGLRGVFSDLAEVEAWLEGTYEPAL
ncbi:MAG TPA: lysophospholipid acyltransferase family protein, partial [Candidatus Dormibacteraeota bacterium]|nr:lysophospholipid acyltransferase family protein [Candidatus Dormibacteraeota bacterium]